MECRDAQGELNAVAKETGKGDVARSESSAQEVIAGLGLIANPFAWPHLGIGRQRRRGEKFHHPTGGVEREFLDKLAPELGKHVRQKLWLRSAQQRGFYAFDDLVFTLILDETGREYGPQ